MTRDFPLPLDEDVGTEEEAVREGIQYGMDLIDGLLPWFQPEELFPSSIECVTTATHGDSSAS